MFETQLGLRENPFLAGHHPKYLFPSRAHRDALVHLRDGLEHREPFILITGDPGTGRTLAVYDALGEWGARAVVALMTQPDLTPDELFEEICLRFGVDAPGQALTSADLGALLAAMHARGDLAILVIDGAEVLDDELLSALERLSLLEVKGESLLRIILVGYPEFESVLARPELQSLDDRIQARHRMEVLSADETVEYLHHRIAVAGGDPAELFPTDTCFEVFRFAGGVPGEVNHIALQALRMASEEGSRTVTPEHVLAVAEADGLDGAPTENEPMIGHAAPAAPPRAARADTANGNRTVEQPPAPEFRQLEGPADPAEIDVKSDPAGLSHALAPPKTSTTRHCQRYSPGSDRSPSCSDPPAVQEPMDVAEFEKGVPAGRSSISKRRRSWSASPAMAWISTTSF